MTILSSESSGALLLWHCDERSRLLSTTMLLFLMVRAQLNWTAVFVWYVWWDVVQPGHFNDSPS